MKPSEGLRLLEGVYRSRLLHNVVVGSTVKLLAAKMRHGVGIV
jgi:hypothetical protein